MSSKFTNSETNIIKGFACILLLYHHLFYSLKDANLYFHFGGFDFQLLNTSAVMSKVCVSIFLILSGYGLTKSATKNCGSNIKFVWSHIIKLLFQFWFIYLIFVPFSWLFSSSTPTNIYGHGITGYITFGVDFLGLASLINTPTMNPTWWFMGEILLYYLVFPLMRYAIRKIPVITLVFAGILCFVFSRPWTLAFLTGILLAEYNFFEKFSCYSVKSKVFLLCTGVLIVPLRLIYYTKADVFFAMWIILIIFTLVPSDNVFGKALGFIGVHSANIFMFHTFIYSIYFKEQLYSLKYPILIFSVLLASCLLISLGIQRLKELIGYNHLQRYVINFCERDDV